MADIAYVRVSEQAVDVTVMLGPSGFVTVAQDNNVVVAQANDERTVTVAQGGAGGSDNYIRATPVDAALGGVQVGATFDGTVQDALDRLLYPSTPTFTAFSFTQTSPLEVGDTVAAGVKAFQWTISNVGSLIADTCDITDLTGGGIIGTSLASDLTESISIGAVTKNTAASHTWQISATDEYNMPLTRNFTVQWYWRIYYGESVLTTLAEADIEGLRVGALASGSSGSYSMNAGGYKYICYPTTMGLKTTFKDPSTNLDVAMEAPYTVAVTNTHGVTQSYYVHRTTNVLGGTINIVVS